MNLSVITPDVIQAFITLLIAVFIPYFVAKIVAALAYYHKREQLKYYRVAADSVLKNKIEYLLTARIMQALLFLIVFAIIIARAICDENAEPISVVFVIYLVAVASMFLVGINTICWQQKNLSYSQHCKVWSWLKICVPWLAYISILLLSRGALTWRNNFDKDIPYFWTFVYTYLPVAVGFCYVFSGKEKEQNKRDYEIITDDKQQKYAVVFSDGCDSSTVIQRAVIKNAAEGDAENVKTSAVLEIDITSYQKLDSIKVSYRELRHFDKVTRTPDEEKKQETIAAKIHRLYAKLRGK